MALSLRYLGVIYFLCVLFMFAAEPGLDLISQWGSPSLWANAEEERATLMLLAGLNQSLCSDRATARGPGQRVVAFSFFGSSDHWRGYFKGAAANAREMNAFYPHWTMRLYISTSENRNLLRRIRKLELTFPHLDICDVTTLPLPDRLQDGLGMGWRWLPMIDPLVDVFVSRDLDSRPSPREAAAVSDWLRSNLSFHVMRDHIFHSKAMLGGMWGARKDLERQLVMRVGNRLLKSVSLQGGKGVDQDFLRYFAWPSIKGKVLQHDSYYCESYFYKKHGNMRPWPTKRLGTDRVKFVGCIIAVLDKKQPPCPKACRPVDHQDWITC